MDKLFDLLTRLTWPGAFVLVFAFIVACVTLIVAVAIVCVTVEKLQQRKVILLAKPAPGTADAIRYGADAETKH